MSGTDEHVGMDQLADDGAGLLSAEQSERISAHVAGCEKCARRRADLGRVEAALHGIPPVAMPADVGERIDQALVGARGASQTVVPLHAAAPRRRGASFAGIAAVAAVIALVAVVLVSHFTAGSNPESSAGTVAGGSTGGEPIPVASIDTQQLLKVEKVTGSTYTGANLADRLSRALSTSTSRPSASASTHQGSAANSNTSSGLAGPDLTTESGAVPHGLEPLRNPSILTRCVSQVLAGDLSQPVDVDLAHFNGKPAVVIVVPGINKSDFAYVADATCGQPNYNGLILDYAEVHHS